MILDFLNDETTRIQSGAFNTGCDEAHPAEGYSIPFSGDIAGIELRMLPPFVKNNHTVRFWPFPGRARLYCLTMVISDTANQLSGQMDLNAFPRIGNRDYLPINKTIYYWQEDEAGLIKPPSQLHVMCSIIKSKEGLRETGDILTQVKNDNDYQNLMDRLTSVITETAPVTAIANMTLQAAHIIGQHLGKVDDQPIGTIINSFTRLHGDWDRIGIHPIHIATRDVDFQYELIIRDKYRVERLKENQLVLPIAYQPPSKTSREMVPM